MEEDDFGSSQVARVRKYLWNLTEYPETSFAARASSDKLPKPFYSLSFRHLLLPQCPWWSSPPSPSCCPPCPIWPLTWTWSCLTTRLVKKLDSPLSVGKRWQKNKVNSQGWISIWRECPNSVIRVCWFVRLLASISELKFSQRRDFLFCFHFYESPHTIFVSGWWFANVYKLCN